MTTTFLVRVSWVTLVRNDLWAFSMVFFTRLKCWLALQHGGLLGLVGPGLVSTPALTRRIWTIVKMVCSNKRHTDAAALARNWSCICSISLVLFPTLCNYGSIFLWNDEHFFLSPPSPWTIWFCNRYRNFWKSPWSFPDSSSSSEHGFGSLFWNSHGNALSLSSRSTFGFSVQHFCPLFYIYPD